jgi:thiaminase/transcriptional activator TenA
MRVYLAGPPFADDYRREAVELLRAGGHEPVDPMRRDFRGRTEGNEDEIVLGDLADIDSCDVLLADFGEPDEGTSMEAWYARSQGTPVVVWTRGRRPHPWTVWVASSLHEALPEAVAALGPVLGEGRFTDRLRSAADRLWRAQREHPFVTGIADGTLAPERFLHYLRQDSLFLEAYAAALQAAAARAPDEQLAERFTWLAGGIVEAEQLLHRRLADEWGVSEDDLVRDRPTATTDAYARCLLGAADGDYAELLATILPCAWGYSDLGQRLARDFPRPSDERYARWIDLYASEEFARVAEWCRRALDDAAARESPEARARLRDAFLESSRHELAFWEASWREEPALEAAAG